MRWRTIFIIHTIAIDWYASSAERDRAINIIFQIIVNITIKWSRNPILPLIKGNINPQDIKMQNIGLAMKRVNSQQC